MVDYIGEHDIQTFRLTLGDTGLGHGVGLGDKWGHGAGTWGGFRGQVGTRGWDMGWVEGTSMVDYIGEHDIQTFRLTLGDTGLGMGWV